MKRVLVITDSIDVNDSSGSKANVAFITSLSSFYNVTVLHTSASDINLSNVECHWINTRKISLFYFITASFRLLNRLIKVDLNFKTEKYFGFSIDYLYHVFLFRKSIPTLASQAHMILTLSKGSLFRPHYAMLAFNQYYHKWVAYIHDPYPFQFWPRPYNFVPPGYKQKDEFFSKLSKSAFCFAFPSNLLSNWVGSYYPEMFKNMFVIPHQQFNDFEKDETSIFDNNFFNLVHTGTLINGRPINYLLQAFLEMVKDDNLFASKAILHFYGPMHDQKKDLDYYVSILPENIRFDSTYIPFNRMQSIQHQSSVNMVIESKSEISPFLPGKIPHLISAGRQMILLSPYYGETKRLMGDSFKFWSEVDDIIKIKSILSDLFNCWMEKGNEGLVLKRQDLDFYFSSEYMFRQLNSIRFENSSCNN